MIPIKKWKATSKGANNRLKATLAILFDSKYKPFQGAEFSKINKGNLSLKLVFYFNLNVLFPARNPLLYTSML